MYHECYHDVAVIYVEVQPEFCTNDVLSIDNIIQYSMIQHLPRHFEDYPNLGPLFTAFQRAYAHVMLPWIQGFPECSARNNEWVSTYTFMCTFLLTIADLYAASGCDSTQTCLTRFPSISECLGASSVSHGSLP